MAALVFAAAWAFSNCAEQGLLELQGLLCCRARAPGLVGFRSCGHGLGCPAACGIFLDRGSNLGPLHGQVPAGRSRKPEAINSQYVLCMDMLHVYFQWGEENVIKKVKRKTKYIYNMVLCLPIPYAYVICLQDALYICQYLRQYCLIWHKPL